MPTNHAPMANRYGDVSPGSRESQGRQTRAVLHNGKREGGNHERAFQQREEHDGRWHAKQLFPLEGQRGAFFPGGA